MKNKSQDFCKNCRNIFHITKLKEHTMNCVKEVTANFKYNDSPFRKIETNIVKLSSLKSERKIIAEYEEPLLTFGNNKESNEKEKSKQSQNSTSATINQSNKKQPISMCQ